MARAVGRTTAGRKGQAGLMEYILLTFFIMIVVVVLIFFLIGYQITQFTLEKQEASGDRALGLAKRITSSELFAKEEGVLDDGKLTGLSLAGNDLCPELEKLFGPDVFFSVRIVGEPEERCTQASYPDCTFWTFCEEEGNRVAVDLPVNVYRNAGLRLPSGILPQTELGLLTAGVKVQ